MEIYAFNKALTSSNPSFPVGDTRRYCFKRLYLEPITTKMNEI